MATVTMDYDEFDKLKSKADCNDAKIREKVNKEFNNWRKQYEEQRKRELAYRKEGILHAIRMKKTLCSINTNIFGNIAYKDIVKYFDDLEDMVREL